MGESQLLNDIDAAITFHETKTQSQAHITFWKNVRSAIVAEAVPDSLKAEFDRRAAGAKPGGKFYQLYMDVAAEFERILAPPPIPTATLSASPETIELGQPATLAWSTENADTVTLDQIAVPASGSKVVSPVATTHYYLVATGEGGSTQADVTLEVTLPVAQQSDSSQDGQSQQPDQNTQQTAGWADASDIVIEEGGYLQQQDFAIVLAPGDTSARVAGSPWPGYAGVPLPPKYARDTEYAAGEYVYYVVANVHRIFRRRTPGSDNNAFGITSNTNKGKWEDTSPYDGNGVAHGFGIVPMDWPAPGYITIRSFEDSGTPFDRYPAYCTAQGVTNPDCGAGAPLWQPERESLNTDGTGHAKISIEVNTVDDNIVQADRVHSLGLSVHGKDLGSKRIVIKEDDFWRAYVSIRPQSGGRCVAWAACQKGPAPQQNRYTIRNGIEFGQPGYDPNAAVTGCRYDLWDKSTACAKTVGGSGPKRLIIETGGPLVFSKGLDGPNGGDHYDLGEGVGSYYDVGTQRRSDGAPSTVKPGSPFQIYAYCSGPGCGNRPWALAAAIREPYETVTIPANVFTDPDSFDRSLVSGCATGAANISFKLLAPKPLQSSVRINGQQFSLKLPPSGDQIELPESGRIKFHPPSINWCG